MTSKCPEFQILFLWDVEPPESYRCSLAASGRLSTATHRYWASHCCHRLLESLELYSACIHKHREPRQPIRCRPILITYLCDHRSIGITSSGPSGRRRQVRSHAGRPDDWMCLTAI